MIFIYAAEDGSGLYIWRFTALFKLLISELDNATVSKAFELEILFFISLKK